MATWTSYGGQDGDLSGVYGQLYSSTGARVLGEFQVNTATTGYQQDPSVASLSNGSFVVTWTGRDSAAEGIYAQRYSAAGARVGSEFRVNTHTANTQRRPSVAALANGGFVVIWQSWGQDGFEGGIFGQRYSAAGAPVDAEFGVNTHRPNTQDRPSVAGLSYGGFVVTWHSFNQDAAGTLGVYGQLFIQLLHLQSRLIR